MAEPIGPAKDAPDGNDSQPQPAAEQHDATAAASGTEHSQTSGDEAAAAPDDPSAVNDAAAEHASPHDEQENSPDEVSAAVGESGSDDAAGAEFAKDNSDADDGEEDNSDADDGEEDNSDADDGEEDDSDADDGEEDDSDADDGREEIAWDDTPIRDLFPTEKVRQVADPALNYGTLYIVSTPIGHVDDITLRALEILKKADMIVCEEIKPAARLLHEHRVSKDLTELNEHNEAEASAEVLEALKEGKSVALISDAGTPLLADPGEVLVHLAIENRVPIKAVPGASSVLAGLVCSGLPTRQFIFAGFLSREPSERLREFGELAREKRTVVLLETPYRLKPLLEAAAEVMPERRAFLGCKLTTSFETMHHGTMAELKAKFEGLKFKGEFVLAFAGIAVDEKVKPVPAGAFDDDEDEKPRRGFRRSDDERRPGGRSRFGDDRRSGDARKPGRSFRSRGERGGFDGGKRSFRDDDRRRDDDGRRGGFDGGKRSFRDDDRRRDDDGRRGGFDGGKRSFRDDDRRRDDDGRRGGFDGGKRSFRDDDRRRDDEGRRGGFDGGLERPKRSDFNKREDDGPKQALFKRSDSEPGGPPPPSEERKNDRRKGDEG